MIKSLNSLKCKCYLRYKHYNLPSGINSMFNNIKIHFCLSASGYSSYKICIERSIIIILHYCINGSLLFLVKHNLFIKNVLIRHRISIVTFNLDIYNSVCFKCLYCCWRNIKLVFYYLHINNRFINKCTHKPVLSFRFFLIYAYKFLCLFSINQKADRLFLLMSDLVLNRNNRL